MKTIAGLITRSRREYYDDYRRDERRDLPRDLPREDYGPPSSRYAEVSMTSDGL